ncbi:hypothetical protein INR49_009286 [Caranx melampygus]|nr:hypothetical protein INR49_009286 [Caranx melampygus]
MCRSPQVEVHINGIPSRCSGDCGFDWSEERTPVVSGISPTQVRSGRMSDDSAGSSLGLGTLLTITGTGFSSENASIMVGGARCRVEQVTESSQVCRLGSSSAGTVPVWVSFPSLGRSRYADGRAPLFTYQLIVSSFSPPAGSVAGGTLLTLSGFGFSPNATVSVGGAQCTVVWASDTELSCRTPPGAAGSVAVAVTVGNMSETSNSSFTYDDNLTPQISAMSPNSTTVSGRRLLTVQGSNLGARDNGSMVLVGGAKCVIMEWTDSNITCLLPMLPPGWYKVDVQLKQIRRLIACSELPVSLSPSNSVDGTIEFVLEFYSVSPLFGSLMGGTRLTVSGSGFSTNASDNRVSVGEAVCEVTDASEHELQCVLQSEEQTHVVTNDGSHRDYGRGYAWSPASLTVSVGDTVIWRWEAPPFQTVGYRVFSVSSPSGTEYEGGAFSSGDTKTDRGSFRYRFTSPGVFYYSSGFIDDARERLLQGVVRVQRRAESSSRVLVSVGGVEARYVTGGTTRPTRQDTTPL